MRTERIKKTLVVSMILLLAGASLAFARGGSWGDRGGPMMGPGLYGPRGVCLAADLTEAQRTELTAARDAFFAETRALREQIREKRWALRDALITPDPDTALVTQLQTELSRLQGEFDLMALEHKLEMRRILPEGAEGGAMGRRAFRGFRGEALR